MKDIYDILTELENYIIDNSKEKYPEQSINAQGHLFINTDKLMMFINKLKRMFKKQ